MASFQSATEWTHNNVFDTLYLPTMADGPSSIRSVAKTVLSTGCPHINDLLNGGLPRRGITEIAGEAGAGKTQLSIGLALRTAIAGHSVIYLDTEDLNADRMLEMAGALLGTNDTSDIHLITNNIKLFKALDLDTFQTALGQVSLALSHLQPKLLIIDSVAAIYRVLGDELGIDASGKSRGMFSLANLLNEWNIDHDVAIVVVNQVSDVIDPRLEGILDFNVAPVSTAAARAIQAVPSNGRWLKAALGPSWGNCVHTRILMTHPRSSTTAATSAAGMSAGGKSAGAEGSLRKLYLVASPALPPAQLSYTVTTAGVIGQGPPQPIPGVIG